MSRQAIGLLIAGLVSAAVLGGTLWIAAGEPPIERDGTRLTDDDRFGGLSTPGEGDGDPMSGVPGVGAGQFWHDDGDGRIFLVRHGRLDRQPRGTFAVDRPEAEIYLDNQRAMLLTADEATVVAPKRHFRRGVFRGNVVLSVFEGTGDRDVNPNRPTDLRFRVYLDQATFNRDFGEVLSTGPVRVVGSGVTFEGHGLNLRYDAHRNRLDTLRITEGRSLRFDPAEAEKLTADEPATALADASSMPPAPGGEPGGATDTTTPAPADDDNPFDFGPPAGTYQYYVATFQQDVRVRVEGETPGGRDRANMAGDRLEARFSLGNEKAFVAEPDSAFGSDGSTPHGEPAATAAITTTATTTAGSDRPSQATDRGGAVTITWSGPMEVSPLETKPRLLLSKDDVQLQLYGRPATIFTDRDEAVLAAEVAYVAELAVMAAAASDTTPMLVTSPGLGTMTARSLSIDQTQRTGTIIGPGRLVAFDDDATLSPLARMTAGLFAADAQVAVEWGGRLQLWFADPPADQPADPADAAAPGPGQAPPLGDLMHARFLGGVRAGREDFALTAPRLDLAFADHPLKPGKTYPTVLTARGGVEAVQPGLRVRAGRLDAELYPPDELRDDLRPATRPADDGGETDAVVPETEGVRVVTGRDGVWITLDEQDVTMAGDTMLAEPALDQLQLFAERGMDDTYLADSYATADTPEGRLEGRHLILKQTTEEVFVRGAGRFTALLRDNEMADDGATASAATDLTHLQVTWADALAFHHRDGLARFTGDVYAETASRDARTLLRADDDLTLRFDPAPADSAEPAPAGGSATDEDPEPQLRLATATGNAEFEAQSYTSAEPAPDAPRPTLDAPPAPVGRLATRVKLRGPLITFTNLPAEGIRPPTEQVQVVGKGQMQIEDYRDDAPAEGGDPAGADAVEVMFTGRGVTLFDFAEQLTLDARLNDMRVTGNVWMIHQPMADPNAPAGEEPVGTQLHCQRLFADLAETGGLGAWTGGDGPEPDIQRIAADRGVRVVHGPKRIDADHLLYRGGSDNILLWSDPGGEVRLEDDTRPGVPFSAGSMIWDRKNNRFEARDVGPLIAPLRRDD